MGGYQNDDYVDVAERIRDMLSGLPVGKRGPKRRVLSESLTSCNDLDACWPWRGRIARNGYGLGVWPHDRTTGTTAHRLVWQLLNGPVSDDMQVDHLCHDVDSCDLGDKCPHRSCVNPTHLQVVTPAENLSRSASPSALNAAKTHCQHGHAFEADNTYVDGIGRRSCRTCLRRIWRERGH